MKTFTIGYMMVLLMSIQQGTRAQSPILATELNRPYSAHEMVITAGYGEMTHEIMEFLGSPTEPIDVKMAVINRLGRPLMEEQDRVRAFFNYLKSSAGYRNRNEFMKRGKDHELLCLAYLTAINYPHKSPDAIEMAEMAVTKNQTASFTFRIICSLIKAEGLYHEFQWCSVYHIVAEVNNDTSLFRDMPEDAVRAIFLEIDTYHEHCLHPDERGRVRKRQ